MNIDRNAASRSRIFFVLIIAIFLLSAFTPARWFGLETKTRGYTPVDFSKLKNSNLNTYDKDDNGQVTWEELTKGAKYGDAIIAEAKNNPPSEETLRTLNDPNNLTSSLSKNLYLASTQINNIGGVSADEQQRIIDELALQEAKKITSKKYLYSEIHVAKTEDKNTIHAYGNAVASTLQGIITKEIITKEGGALAVFASTKDQEGVTDITALQDESSRIDGILKKLVALSVPPSASFYHISMLNQLTLYRDTLSNLSKVKSDPVRARIVLGTYPDTLVTTLLIYKKFSDYFTLKNVIFDSYEAGYVFTIGYTLE